MSDEPILALASGRDVNGAVVEDGGRVEHVAAVLPAAVGQVQDATLVPVLSVLPLVLNHAPGIAVCRGVGVVHRRADDDEVLAAAALDEVAAGAPDEDVFLVVS